jgi:SAM-dependent methyltransferase
MKASDITRANKAAWEEAAPLHRSQNMAKLLSDFRQPGHSCLDDVEADILQSLGVEARDVTQLCCNNGQELLSIKNMGAGRCVGFDAAAGFIDQARELAAASGIEADFVCTDIYDIDPVHDSSFDLAIVTIGVLSWMPDLGGFFAVAARLLRPGGALFIHEQHPILEMFMPGAADEPIVWEYSYFHRDAIVETDGLDYYGGGTYQSKPLYSFIHKISDVIMAGVEAGFAVEQFEERPAHISMAWYNVEHQLPQLPKSFTLVLRKPLPAPAGDCD